MISLSADSSFLITFFYSLTPVSNLFTPEIKLRGFVFPIVLVLFVLGKLVAGCRIKSGRLGYKYRVSES